MIDFDRFWLSPRGERVESWLARNLLCRRNFHMPVWAYPGDDEPYVCCWYCNNELPGHDA